MVFTGGSSDHNAELIDVILPAILTFNTMKQYIIGIFGRKAKFRNVELVL